MAEADLSFAKILGIKGNALQLRAGSQISGRQSALEDLPWSSSAVGRSRKVIIRPGAVRSDYESIRVCAPVVLVAKVPTKINTGNPKICDVRRAGNQYLANSVLIAVSLQAA